MTKTKNILFWTGTILTTLFFGLLTFMSLSEWWTIKFKKQTSVYPWGPVNQNPWFYDNPETYSTVMLTEGLVYIVALTILTTQIIKANKKGILYSLMFCFGLFIIMIINSTIK
jgi:hypothetical protein